MSKEKILETAIEVLDNEINALKFVKRNLNDNIADAVEIINKSNKVIISGIGKSGAIGKKIAATFSSVGIVALFMHPVEAMHGDIGMVAEGDALILLSKSGATEELMRIVPYLKNKGVKIISIVGNLNSPLAKYSDVVLDGSVESEACPFNLAPTSSAIAALALGDVLAVCLMKARDFNREDFSNLHPSGQIGRNVNLKVSDVMHANGDLPFVKPNDTFKSAILQITDKALGCVCVCDNDMKLLGIITDGDIRRSFEKYDDIRGLTAERIMTINPITIDESAPLADALSVMENRNSQISVLPVIDLKGECKGVIRIHDIIRSGL